MCNVFTVRLQAQLPQIKGANKAQFIANEDVLFEFPSNKDLTEAWKANKPMTVDVNIPAATYAMSLKLWSKDGILKSTSQVFTLTELIMYEQIPLICNDKNTGWVKLIEIPDTSEQCQPLTDPFASSDISKIHKTFKHITAVNNILESNRFRDYASRFIPIKVYNAVDFFKVLLFSLWKMLSEGFTSVENKMQESQDSTAILPLRDMRYSIFEDVLIQVKNQMEYIEKREDVSDDILKRFVRIFLHTCLMLFGWSFHYPMTNNNPVHPKWFDGCSDSYLIAEAEVEMLQRNLLKLRVDMASHLGQGELLDIPASMKGELLLEHLFVNALREVLDADEKHPYQNLFSLLRGGDAEWAFDRIDKEFKQCVSDSSDDRDRRDALRHLLTHVAKASGRLPRFIWLNDKKLLIDKEESWRIGRISSVYKCEWLPQDRQISKAACKQYHNGYADLNETVLQEYYLDLIHCLYLNHPNVLKLYGVYYHDKPMILMPFMENGSVLSYVRRNKEKRALIDKWILQVARGLRYLHQEKVVHGCLSTWNILVDDNENAVITDYGFPSLPSLFYEERYRSFRLPELPAKPSVDNHPSQDKVSNVYSFGLLCIGLYTGVEAPAKGTETSSPNNFGMSSKLWDIVGRCVRPERGARPDMDAVVKYLEGQGIGSS